MIEIVDRFEKNSVHKEQNLVDGTKNEEALEKRQNNTQGLDLISWMPAGSIY